MSKDTDHTPEDNLIEQQLAKLIEVIERTGRKVTGLHIQFETRQQQRFELRPVDDQAAETDNVSTLFRDDEPLH